MRNLEKDRIEMAAKREAMLQKGFEIFSKNGIEPVAMQEIANACGVGIATLYRYYNTKLDFVIDIGTRQWQDYGKYANKMRQKSHIDHMTAAEEMEFFLDFYIDLYKKHKDLLRFNQNFNNFVQREGATKEQLKDYLLSIGQFNVYFAELYEKGKKDGTIRTDMPEEKMFALISHIVLGVVVRFAQGLVYSADNKNDRFEELEILKRMILNEYVIK